MAESQAWYKNWKMPPHITVIYFPFKNHFANAEKMPDENREDQNMAVNLRHLNV